MLKGCLKSVGILTVILFLGGCGRSGSICASAKPAASLCCDTTGLYRDGAWVASECPGTASTWLGTGGTWLGAGNTPAGHGSGSFWGD